MNAEQRKKRRGAGAALLAAALLCALLAGGALAAVPVEVWLDGTPLTFTDAVPEVVEGRTFLPYRAVFTALGAEVSFEEDTRTAVAVRGEVTVRVPLGGTQVTVTEDGADRLLEMDVASYVKDGRTYVPVRFMAQALGCLVGWDDANRTVILIDAQKLAREAVAGQSYSMLERYRAFLAGFQTGNWAVEGELEHRIEENGTVLVTTGGQFSGLTAGENKMELSLTLDTDRSAWYQAQADAQGLTLEQAGVTENDLYAALTLELRGDAAKGAHYLYATEAAGSGADLPLHTWLSMGAGAEVAGVDLTSLLRVEGDVDAVYVVAQALNELTLNDRAAAMAAARELADLTAANLSNEGFGKEDGSRVARWTAGGLATTLTLTLDGQGEVTAFVLEQTLAGDGDKVVSRSEMDAQGNVRAEMAVTSGGQTVTMRQTGRYTPSDEAPQTATPAGAAVTPYGG